jgi:hypothetical protein
MYHVCIGVGLLLEEAGVYILSVVAVYTVYAINKQWGGDG